MQKLVTQKHKSLTEKLLKTLAQNRIITISDFLQEDTEKLLITTKLTLPELLDIRSHILLKYSAHLINGITLLEHNKREFIPTNIGCLDTALEGGLPIGYITEICGLAGSGKTQLCLKLAINCAKELESSVLYISTKGDFSALRVQKILEECGCNHKQMASVMFRIKVVNVWNMEEAVKLLRQIKNDLLDNLCLIILDALPCLMFQHLGDINKVGLKLLNELVNVLRFLSNDCGVAVVCVNIQTRWLEQDVTDIDDDEESNLTSKEIYTERRNRCLGKYWQHIPLVLLLIEKSDDINNKNCCQIQVQIHKSRLPEPEQIQQCILELNELGINSA